MSDEKLTLTQGRPMGVSPPYEGYLPVMNGPSFDILAFFSGLNLKSIQDWLRGEVRYGIYIERSIPVFILDLGQTWSLDVYLNILREDEDTRKHFFEGDPRHTKIHLVLASYPDAVVQGLRTIAIDPDQMHWVKEACFNQLSRYSSKEECGEAAEQLLQRFSSKMLRKMASIS